MDKQSQLEYCSVQGKRHYINNFVEGDEPVIRKKILSVLALGAAAAIALTGCANNAKPGGNDSGGASGEGVDFPTKNITLVVPWNPGGDGDMSARALASQMEDELGVKIIVENRPGANGSIGWQSVKTAPADGYTMTMSSVESATLQFMDYDITPEDFVFLGQATRSPGGLAVPANAPYDTFEEFQEYAKANPGMTYSSPGTGSSWDLPTRALAKEIGAEFSGVPFDGSAPSVQAVAAGHVEFAMNVESLINPFVESGDLKWLAVSSEERHESLPDVPTFLELGVDLVASSWVGLKVPAGTPTEVVEILSDALTAAVESDEFANTVEAAKLVPTVRPYPEMGEWVLEIAAGYKPLFEEINAE